MAKDIYIGVNSEVRRVKQPYIGVDNIARKVKKAYIGVNNVARLFYVSCEHENASYVETDTIYHLKTCLDCGEVIEEMHIYSGETEDTGDGYIWEYCTKCGFAHPVDSGCTHPNLSYEISEPVSEGHVAECYECGYVKVEPHDWQVDYTEAGDGSVDTCTKCGLHRMHNPENDSYSYYT